MRIIFIALSIGICCTAALAQSVCSDEVQSAYDGCVVACAETHVADCQPEGVVVTYESAVAKCDCESSRNFGQYNSCLKKARNLLRSVGLLDDTAKANLAVARKECKTAKRAAKNEKSNAGRKPSQDDSEDNSVD